MICFQNDGLIDLTAVTTFGVSVKETKSPIGFFGTGLKYAIAIILRHGGKITIYRGLEKNEFTLNNMNVRGVDFKIISMNGKDLGFTTELGKNWHIWQAFREIYCNMLDEGGSVSFKLAPAENKTTVVVSCTDFELIYNHIENYFITNNQKPIQQTTDIEFYPYYSKETAPLFYRGVKVHDIEKATLFKYNLLKTIELTEDRTIKNQYMIRYDLATAVASCGNRKIMEDVLLANKDYYESSLNFASCYSNDIFLDVIGDLLESPKRGKINISALKYYDSYRQKKPIRSEIITKEETEQIKRSQETLKKMGYLNIFDYEIIVVNTLGDGVLGKALDGKIYLSKPLFHEGERKVLGTIFEEYCHLNFGYIDENRIFQNYLIDTIAKIFAELAELQKSRKKIPW